MCGAPRSPEATRSGMGLPPDALRDKVGEHLVGLPCPSAHRTRDIHTGTMCNRSRLK
ncbi:hypothetical protein GPNCGGLF_LOCUS813 [Methylorubrum aminovorans]